MSDRTGFQDRCIQPLCHPSGGATEDSSTPKSLTPRAIALLQRPFTTLARYARDLVIEPHKTSLSGGFGPYNCPSDMEPSRPGATYRRRCPGCYTPLVHWGIGDADLCWLCGYAITGAALHDYVMIRSSWRRRLDRIQGLEERV